MKLSVVIPVYRVSSTLDRCVESIVGQTLRNLEIILVDDGSPDDCPAKCDEWARRDSRIKVIHKANGGLSDARNAGIKAATGDIVTFVDSDDFLATDTYEQLLPLTQDADIVEFPIYWQYGSPKQEVRRFGSHCYTDMNDYWLHGRAYEHTYACNKLFHLKLFEDVSFPKGKVFEDVCTLPRLLKKARRVTTTDKGLYYYCHNAESITSTATGRELDMLLSHHLEMMECPDIRHDARYYMHVLNIQMDVFELARLEPRLPFVPVNPLAPGLSFILRLKAVALNLLGMKNLCRLNKFIHRLMPNRS